MTDVISDAKVRLIESLQQSVSLVAKKWHPAIIRCLATSDGLGHSELRGSDWTVFRVS